MPVAIDVGSLDSLATGIASWYAAEADRRPPRGSGRRLRRHLARRCDAVYARLPAFEAPAGSSVASALEWLLDNHYVVRAALNQLGRDLPPGHHGRLPAVRDARGRPVPRLARIVRSLLDATGMPLDLERMQEAVLRLQAETPLTLAELWALPVFLRAELLGRLAGAAARMLDQAGERTTEEVHASGAPPLSVISGCILGLRQLATFRWTDFVERTSVVEAALRRDPAGVYARMNPESRDRYRRAVEELAACCHADEQSLARAAVGLAASQPPDAAAHLRHVGFYLVDAGRERLEVASGGRPRLPVRLGRYLRRHATAPYIALILAPAATLVLLACWALGAHGLHPWWVAAFAVAALVPAVSLSTIGGNWLVTQLVLPRTLVRLDFEHGIPADWAAAVVMPAMLTDAGEVRRLATNLELNYLGNADPALHFALLTDWPDAGAEHAAGDEETLALAVAAVDELNERHGGPGRRPFALFHRRRTWNEAEGRWMGWERKRGKLVEFSRLLLGDARTSFQRCHADLEQVRRARLVITLDADTRMPAGVAAQFVGILAHPLNRPVSDPATGRVVRGYTIVQPRVEIDPSSVEESTFARLFAGDVALDPYVHAVSDVYQDLFGAGIYAGKGAFDVVAFSASVEGNIPDNAVLSHDLLEGVHGRVAYASDVMLLEDFPANLAAMTRRMHRWVRGDWQLLPWLLPVPAIGGRRLARLCAIDRWKVLDNLRRSLQPASLLTLLLVVWMVAPHPLPWTLLVLALPSASAVVQLVTATRTAAWRWGTWASTARTVAERVGEEVLRWFASLAFLPYDAAVSVDAILRALYRQRFSRRGLLDWETAAAAAARLRGAASVRGSYRQMWPTWAIGLVVPGATAWLHPSALATVVPVAGLWCAAPWLAAMLGRPRPPPPAVQFSAAGAREARQLARRTWRFFEQFVGPDGHWLPPDNVQVAPGFAVARRTSPTNIGLTLLATLSAYDFGYLTAEGLVGRLQATLRTVRGLPTYRGHLYNWYETRSLRPLEPRYVSTVDSGNLVAALMTLRQALLSLDRAQAGAGRLTAGVVDTLWVLQRLVEEPGRAAAAASLPDLSQGLAHQAEALADATADRPAALDAVAGWVRRELEPMLLGATTRAASPQRLRHLEELHDWMRCLLTQVESARRACAGPAETRGQVASLVADIDAILAATDFRFLFDPDRRLFHIGYNASMGEVDGSHYDLLASEARIASFVAIARGDAPPTHWMHLGRPLRRVRGHRTLLSWSATAFEYLMPRLLMKTPASSLLYHSCVVAVAEQRRVARRLGIAWGVSESGYYQMDLHGEYQYRAFGVPRLALRREQSDRMVVAPYASVLALPFDAAAVLANLRELGRLGLEDSYGMAEAADFGHPSGDFSRRPRVVHAFMAHHQGMIMTALGNAVHGDLMLQRFHADHSVASVEYLLYERLPRRPDAQPLQPRLETRSRQAGVAGGPTDWPVDPARPALNVLSNGQLRTLITSQGGGACYWNDVMLNRWRPEADGEYGGAAIFLRDLDSGESWSLGWDELGGDALQVDFAAHQGEFRLRRHGLMVRLTVAVAADDDLEARRLVIGNDLDRQRRLRVVFQAEPVMAREADDRRHAAFNKLFIECEGQVGPAALLFRRRPRAADEPPLFLGYAAAVHGPGWSAVRTYTDRTHFIGRRGDPRRPAALAANGHRAGGRETRLEPVVALELDVVVPPTASVQCAFLTAAGRDRHRLLDLLDRHRSTTRVAWLISQARAAAGQEVALLKLHADEVRLAMGLAQLLLWPRRRPQRAVALEEARAAEQSLWSHGLSGDYPVALLRLRGPEDLPVAELLLRLHALFRRRGFEFDLAFLDEASAGYSQPTRDRLASLIERSRELPAHARRGVAVIIPGRNLGVREQAGLIAGASLYLDPDVCDPKEFLAQSAVPRSLPEFVPVPTVPLAPVTIDAIARRRDLRFDNGYGGFTPDGREYQVYIEAGAFPPAPWANVMANPEFGAMASDGGLGFTWAGNSSEHRLTPWFNDPVTDRCGEACYLRDEESGTVWTPTPLPLPAAPAYRVSHGAGYTRFEHNSHGLEQVLTVFVDPVRPLKFVRLAVKNRWPRARRLTATLALEWVLGNDRQRTSRWLVSGFGLDGRVLTVRNTFDRAQPGHSAFLTATAPPHATASDRGEFLGRARNPRQVPAALARAWPAGASTDGSDPCGAYQVHLVLDEGTAAQVTFVIGAGESREQALDLAAAHLDEATIDARWRALTEHWDGLLGSLQVETPNEAWNLLGNRWLLYQVMSCRLWGRSGYFQPGGAYGFRDQLQDALALLQVEPAITRQQLLRAAAVQFLEGDVLHWWHTAPLRGVRSRCSDDLLWLPFTVAAYVRGTGDAAALDEPVAYLAGEPLAAGQLEHYAEFADSGHAGSLYEHCCRAIDARLATGAHGLPPIGSGDWNDGLNRVGVKGQGESVWLAWFMICVCREFAPLCSERGEPERARRYQEFADKLAGAAEARGWDGAWYLRGYYDDGATLGGHADEACQLDLNAQSWAVLAGVAPPARQAAAMRAAASRLADPEARVLKLLAPPFDRGERDPGYIKGYPPGVRENGSQYNHAAVWAVWAAADLGWPDEARAWFDWIHPVSRAATREGAERYAVEPYVLAGDIYGVGTLAGRGGWSWYTGSAAWLYRVLLERLLGIERRGGSLRVRPCLPQDWPGYRVRLRYGSAHYSLQVEAPSRLASMPAVIEMDGRRHAGEWLQLVDDGCEHEVVVRPAGPGEAGGRVEAGGEGADPGS